MGEEVARTSVFGDETLLPMSLLLVRLHLPHSWSGNGDMSSRSREGADTNAKASFLRWSYPMARVFPSNIASEHGGSGLAC